VSLKAHRTKCKRTEIEVEYARKPRSKKLAAIEKHGCWVSNNIIVPSLLGQNQMGIAQNSIKRPSSHHLPNGFCMEKHTFG